MATSHHSTEYPEIAYLDPERGIHVSGWEAIPVPVTRVAIFDDQLTPIDKLVYVLCACILDNLRYGGSFYDWTEDYEYCADLLGVSVESYKNSLKKLHNSGYLSVDDMEEPVSPTSKEKTQRWLNESGRSFYLAEYIRKQEERAQEVPKKAAKNSRKSISASLRLQVYKADKYRCVHCGGNEDLSVDHIKPVALGGTNERSNLQTLCQPCNSRKGTKWDGEE